MGEPQTFTIRPLAPGDRDQWQGLWTGYLTFYETSVAAPVYDSTFARLLGSDPHDFSALVAEDAGGRLLGLAHYLFHRHCWRTEDVCYLQDLFTAPEARGRGVGRALIEAVYAAADKAGAGMVYWLTQQDNATARRLYDQIGQVTPFIKYNRA
ncbi:GNAT family N-acetyltransferase [Plastorhodobacter daqingensis]|uniref:GNAT family N-acetyltransferase n=1 Tax=Plastorhodobacter daqingensis TaxID=1387281 RepID=A0ABW2UJL4_9RHOB